MGESMKRGEIWLAFADERWPVVLLSCEVEDSIETIRIVTPATGNFGDLAVEVLLGRNEGLENEGALRVARARPNAINCHWLLTLSRADLIERVGALSSGKLQELDDALRIGGLSR